jgi:hypothetical protein
MAARQESNYEGCAIFIYDAKSNALMARSAVTAHNRANLSIEIGELLPHKNGTPVSVLIMAPPVPQAYLGRLNVHGNKTSIALYNRQSKEGRQKARYAVNLPATIVQIIHSQRGTAAAVPFPTHLVNISTTGLRIRAARDILANGDIFQVRLTIGGKEQILTAEVVHSAIKAAGHDYGCRFIAGLPTGGTW